MGKKDLQKSNALSIQVDAEGNIKYDAIAKYGHGKDRVVHSKFKQLVPKGVLDDDDPELQRPDEETIQKVTICCHLHQFNDNVYSKLKKLV